MHSFLVLSHVIAMIASLGLMTAALLIGLFGSKVAANFSTISIYATAIGGLSGALLLFDKPLTIQCAILTSYLIVMAAIYAMGFARGDAENARFIRRRAIQKR